MEPALKDIYSGPFGVDMMICTKGEKDEFCEAVLNQEGEDVNRTGLGVVPCIRNQSAQNNGTCGNRSLNIL